MRRPVGTRLPSSFLAVVVTMTILAACTGSAGTRSPAPTTSLAGSPMAAASASAATGTGAFVIAGLSANIRVPNGPPDPSGFATSFGAGFGGPGVFRDGRRSAIYVSYQLAPGLAGKVTTLTTSPDGRTITDSAEYPASASGGSFSIAFDDGFAVGDHRTVLTFEPTGDSVTLRFTITEPVPTAAPTPAPTADAAGFRRVGLNEFEPNLAYDLPVTIEIPANLVHVTNSDDSLSHWWMPPSVGRAFETSGTKPETAFFRVAPSINVGYSASKDLFVGAANTDEEVKAYEAQGIDIIRWGRHDLPSFPVLVYETEVPYAKSGQTRRVNTMYFATTIDTNSLIIQYYYALGQDLSADQAIWDRFQGSFKETR